PKELEAQRRTAAVPSQQRRAGGQAATRALAADTDPVAVDPELLCAVVQPAQGCEAVFDAGRKRMLGREAVLDGGGDDAETASRGHAEAVLHLDRAGCEASAMYVEQRRTPTSGRRFVRRVDPHGNVGPALGPGHKVVGHAHTGEVDTGVERADDVEDPCSCAVEVVELGWRQ